MGTFSTVDLSNYNTDKSRTYLDAYATEIGPFANRPCRMLELGIRQGGSLLLWRDLFLQSHVVGLDVIPVDVPDDTGRVHTYVGYQQDHEVLDRMADEWAPDGFDIIIDDASHIGTYSAESFRHLFLNHLKPGGVYVIEDWACGYDPSWPDGALLQGEHLLASANSTANGSSERRAVERAHRRIRALAPAVSKRLDRFPVVKDRLRTVYRRGERAVLSTDLPSHHSGMVGLVKQIVDSCADERAADSGAPVHPFRSVNVYPYQVFIHKAAKSGA